VPRVLLLAAIGASALLLAGASRPAGPGLIGAYSFDQGSGTVAADSSGNGNNGTITNATWNTGKYGGALNFNGTNAYVSLPALGTFYNSGFTLEAWVKKATTTRVDTGVVGSWTSDGGPMIWVDHIAGHYYLTLNTGMSNYLDSGATPTAGTWQHVAATYDGSTARFYLNGTLVASKPFTAPVGTSNSWRIGAYGAGSGGNFDGSIDEVRVYDHALTASDIQTDMATPIGPVDTAPPTIPTGLAKTSSTSTTLSVGWTASNDNVGVVGYDVSLNGTQVGTDTGTTHTFSGLECGTSYTVAVVARDAAGNVSGPASVNASTSPCGSDQGLVAAYSFDGGSGSVLTDNSGNGRDGTIVGASWTPSGKYRSALHFNGTGDYVGLPALGTFYKSAFTLEAWVKKDSSAKGDAAVVGTWTSGQNGGPMLWFDYATSHLELVMSQGGSNYVDSGQLGAAGQWQYLAGTYDGTTARLYLNGTQVASKTFTGNVGDSNTWRIGAYDSTAGGFFDGTVDEVRIYSRALAAGDVAADMARSVGTPDTQAPTMPSGFATTATTGTTISTSWGASTDDVAVVGYNVYLGGTKVTTTPSLSYQFTGLSCGQAYDLAVEAVDAAANASPRSTLHVSTTACDTTAPTVAITAPLSGASLSGPVNVTANAADGVGVAGVQFKLDGVSLGAEDTTAPYSVAWDTRTAGNGPHTLTAVARDAAGNTTTSTVVNVSVNNLNPFVPGLVAAYSLDDSAGTVASDTSGGGHPGTLVGGTWVPGKYGSAVSLNGTGDHVDLQPLGTFYKTGFTLEAWVKKNSTQQVDAGVLGTWTSDNNGGPMIWVDHVSGHYYLTLGKGLSGYVDSGVVPTPGTWQHLGATYDGTTARFYVNGTLVASKTYTSNVGDSNSWRIGAYGTTAGGFFDGTIDEARIYDHALTQPEVQTDMNTSVGPPDTTPPSAPPSLTVSSRTPLSITTSWTAATDNVAVTAYNLYRNGTKVATVAAATTTYTFDALTCNTSYNLAVEAQDGAANVGPRTPLTASTAACDTTPPTVSVTAPAGGATLFGSVTISATASDDNAVGDVTFNVDGVPVGAADASAPYSSSWNTRVSSNATHIITAVARDTSNNLATSAPVTVTVDNTNVPPPGLLAAYSFDQGTGTVLGDASGNGQNGTITGAAWTPGRFRMALHFNGSADRVDLPALGTFYKTGFTMEAWIKKDGSAGNGAVVGTWTSSGSGGPMLWMDYISSHLDLTMSNSGGNYVDSGQLPTPGQWQYLTGTYDGTTARIYVNGVLMASKAFSGNVGDSNTWRIGSYDSPAGGFFDGTIDEVRIYDHALTQPEIQTDMTRPVGTPDTTPPTMPTNFAVASRTPSTITTSWVASTDDSAVTGYNLYRNGTQVATVPSGTGSYTFDSLACESPYTLQVEAGDGAGNLSPRATLNASAGDCDHIPPTVSVTAPGNGATLSGQVTLAATANDDTGINDVTFKVDGVQVGDPDTTTPYSITWDTRTVSNQNHTITAVARDVSNNTTTSSAVTVTVDNSVAPPPPGLVAAYSFDEGAGTTAADRSGRGNTGTLNNVTWNPNGVFGSAASFNGTSSSFVSVNDSSSLDLTNGMTLEAWIKPTSLSGWNTVLMKQQTSALSYGLYANTGSNGPAGDVQTGSEAEVQGPTPLPVNTWSHLAATYNGTVLALYVNGAQVATLLATGPITTSSGQLRIGSNSIWGEPFNGSIDEVRIYNQPLTAAQIRGDMNTSISVPDTTPPSTPANLTANGGLGSATLSWSASTDNVGVAKYDVHRSTTPGFTPSLANRIAQPIGTTYIDTGLPTGTYYYRVIAEDAAGNASAASNQASASVTADSTPPTVSLTAPPAGNVSGTVTVSANASDNGTVVGVQFKLDGSNLGAEDTTAPYSIQWDTLTATNGNHTLTAVARDGANNSTTSGPRVVNVSNTAPAGLVGAYSFDEASGNTVIDSSGRANTGTISGATRLPGKFGSGLFFNGDTSMVTVPDSSSLDLTTGMTLEAWVNPDVLDTWETLLFKETTNNDVYSLYASTNTGLPQAQIFSGGASQPVSGPSALPVNAWSYVTATYDGSNIRLYVNGNQVASVPQTGPISTSSGVLRMGTNNVFHEGYTGAMDEVRIYNRALSASEIQADMRRSITPDNTAPLLTAKTPAGGSTGVGVGTQLTAKFNESMDDTSLSPSSFVITNPQGNVVPGTVSYDDSTHTATLSLSAALSYGTTYTVTVKGGAPLPHVTDLAGNPLASNVSWTFTTEAAPPPVLVVTSRANDFTLYTGQILKAEGLNDYTSIDVSLLSPSFLAPFRVIVLGDTALTSTQVTTLTNWVNAGGTLIALHPDRQLASLLGLTATSNTLSNAYLKVDTTAGTPGNGIVGQTIQFHGTADRYTLNGATAVATLYSTATTATANPAVTLRSVGSNGGRAIAFTYDLAKSIVLTHQGNPAWAGQDRDANNNIDATDLFYGAMAGNVQPDWVDTSKIAIPQADEQQRLLANLITSGSAIPVPRFWYFPFNYKAAVVMTGDDHTGGGTVQRFQTYLAESPAGCSVVNWACVRATSYILPDAPNPLTDAQLSPYIPQGFEVSDHPAMPNGTCVDWTATTLDQAYTHSLAAFASQYPSLPTPQTARIHCWLWDDYVTQPKVELAHGIRFDTNYTDFSTWLDNKPGFMTGSGEIMRFADTDGTPIDVYQTMSVFTDESNQVYPAYANSVFDNAVGPNGYYGVFTTNFHTDHSSHPESDAVVTAAQAHGIPVVSAKQMLTWTDGRDGSSFTNFSWNGGVLGFQLSAAAGSNGIQAMLPLHSRAQTLSTITRGGSSVPFTTQTIKGVDYAVFSGTSGTYSATYGP
jgi:chitodextrinase